jgi:hypothetical protein
LLAGLFAALLFGPVSILASSLLFGLLINLVISLVISQASLLGNLISRLFGILFGGSKLIGTHLHLKELLYSSETH